jgi:hypothetical protein
MKKLIQLLLGLAAINILSFQCIKDNTTQQNSITYQNQVYNIDKGVLEFYGKIHNTGNNIDLTLLSASLTIVESGGLIDSISGTGNGVNFEMFTTGTTALDVGDYTFDKDSTGNVGTFDYGNVILNYNTATKKGTSQDITAGVISVKSAGATYEITFNCTLKNGNGITGYYKGPLKYYDNTQGVSMTKSAVLKHKWWKRTIQ